eukprot:TRINITY_DN65624_c0_g1_i5.p1 TRINITY_DN65624_c0_g1~~TRINITY_DN65624_c0_g1_i5.p1  ORF type:complete len:157 (-),score=12.73 TRINITY_DN65624_c0_g1_i5:691-1110(-)
MGDATAANQNGTFSKDKTLPRLPIPDLDEWAAKLLKWTKSVVDAETHKTTEQNVRDFLEKGDGRKLYKKLQQWASQESLANWLHPMWMDGYLRARCPLPMNINYGLTYPGLGKQFPDWITRAAAVLVGISTFRKGGDPG